MSQVLFIAGKQFTARGRKYDRLTERDAFILSHRPDPLEVLRDTLAALPEGTGDDVIKDLARRSFNEAMRPAIITFDESDAFDKSLIGSAWNLQSALLPDHPELSLEDCVGLVQQMVEEAAAEPELQPDPAQETAAAS